MLSWRGGPCVINGVAVCNYAGRIAHVDVRLQHIVVIPSSPHLSRGSSGVLVGRHLFTSAGMIGFHRTRTQQHQQPQ